MTEESIATGGLDTPIPALDDAPDSGDTGEVQEDAPVTVDDAGAEGEEPVADDADQGDEPQADGSVDAVADDDALLAQFSKRTGLDPNDPSQRKTLDTLVAKEKYIQQLKAENATFKQGQKAASGQQALTKFEQDQMKAAAEAQAAAKPGTQGQEQPKGPSIGQYNDVGQQWMSPQDAYVSLSEAWNHAAQTGDYRQVVATEAALYERRFDAIGFPKVQALVESRLQQFMQEKLGAYLPGIQEQAAERRAAESAEFAYRELAGTDGYKDIRSLDQDQEGPPLVVNGEQYRNTPLNRILAENPWIMHIKRDHTDPQVADRLTYLARLRAAHKIFASGQISSQTAKALVNAGSQQEQRKAQDRVRQSLNRGGTPSRSLDQGKAKPKGYIEELLDSTDGPVSFSEL